MYGGLPLENTYTGQQFAQIASQPMRICVLYGCTGPIHSDKPFITSRRTLDPGPWTLDPRPYLPGARDYGRHPDPAIIGAEEGELSEGVGGGVGRVERHREEDGVAGRAGQGAEEGGREDAL